MNIAKIRGILEQPCRPRGAVVAPWGRHGSRRGFVLLLVLVLMIVLMVLGAFYHYSTVQSKQVFQTFYRNDLARCIGESAVAEWRSGFRRRLQQDAAFGAMIRQPTTSAVVNFTLADLPRTSVLAGELIGGSGATVAGQVSLRHIDRELLETYGAAVYRNTFDGEYQATLALDLKVGLGKPGRQRFSRFLFEFDLKRANLRSRPSDRPNHGYTSSAVNDYVLFVRDCYGEFNEFNGRSLNNDNRTLVIGHANMARRGKIFLGCGRPTDADEAQKFVFFNINEQMRNLIPVPPPPLEVPWNTLKRADMMPEFTAKIEQVLNDARSDPAVTINFYPERIKAIISLDYKPLVGSQNWFQSLVAKVVALFNHFFNKMGNTRDGNKEKGIHVLGDQDSDNSMCSLIEGNVRQRFWQTGSFKIDMSRIADDQQVRDEINRRAADNLEMDIRYFTPAEIDLMQRSSSASPEAKELYKVVKFYQTQDQTILMSMPNAIFPFRPGATYDRDRNSPGTFPNPPFRGRTGPVDFVDYMPFSAFPMRTYRFFSSAELYSSPLYDGGRNVLRLSGIVMIDDPAGGLTIKQNMKYEGQGILISYGNIYIEGDFKKVSPEAMCILYTYNGFIKANHKAAGRVEASLIALHREFDPGNAAVGRRGYVDFSQRRAQVCGNMAVDRLNLDSMAPSQQNVIEYDSDTFTGDSLYVATLGSRVRSYRALYHE